jgi:hypothetical protein
VSNYAAQARTNYFAVKDAGALKEELRSYGIEPEPWSAAQAGADFIFDEDQEAGGIALFSFGSWPSLDEDSVAMRLGAEDDEEVPQTHEDLAALVASHLADGQVAVFTEVGFEKMRYLGGTAVAVNASGERRCIELDDIYGLAESIAGPDTTVTRAHH